MPFIGQDWRDNGDQWMKTDRGSWQRIRRQSLTNPSKSSLSDVFNALDMVNSVSNSRRFNYILKIIEILFKEKLGELSGNAQRTVWQILQRLVDTVMETGDYLTRMQRLIDQFETSIHLAYPFYYYIGSSALWQKNIELLRQMKIKLNDARLKFNVEEKRETHISSIERLPTEIQFEVLKRLDNGYDLIQFGMSHSIFYRLTQELILWKRLCHYHFSTDDKFHRFIKRHDHENIDWKKIFFRLKRRVELKEIYAEMIAQCQTCKTYFWQGSNDHLCLHGTTSTCKILTPKKFLILLF